MTVDVSALQDLAALEPATLDMETGLRPCGGWTCWWTCLVTCQRTEM